MLLVFSIIFVFAGIVGYAAWAISADTDNYLTMATYKNQIVEEYEIPDHVNPFGEVNKIVNVKNTGTVDTIIRLSVKKQFGTRKEDGTFEEDEKLDPEMIEISYNTTSWTQKEDGYFYYNDILKAGTITKEPLFTSYTLSGKMGNEYKGKEAQIIVCMESIQAEGNAIFTLWGMDYKDLGITAPKAPESDPTKVIFLGQGEGFDIQKRKTDLFSGFKNLVPGCARTQMITVKNAASHAAKIYLHAEPVDQEELDADKLQLLDQLLNTYAFIEITNNGKTIYEGPVSGNLQKKASTMKEPILLSVLETDEEVHLKVKLALSPEMDNKYQELLGKVKWVFSAMDGRTPDLIIEKSTIQMTQKGDTYKYTISRIENGTFENMSDFVLTDTLPEQVRITELWTGTYNQDLKYDLLYQTNRKQSWTTWKANLDTKSNHHITVPKLEEGEYITKIRFSYGKVKGAFSQDISPVYMVKVEDNVDASTKIINKIELTAKKGDKYLRNRSQTVTEIYENEISGYKPEKQSKIPQYEITGTMSDTSNSSKRLLQWPILKQALTLVNSPQTGDSTKIYAWLICIGAIFGIGFYFVRKKKK